MARWARRVGVGLGMTVGVVALAAGGGWLWVGARASALLGATVTTHDVDFPVPFPLTPEEVAALRAEREAALPPPAPTLAAILPGQAAAPSEPVDVLAGVDLDAIALERAVERGRHLVQSRFVCIECHGADFGGGTMVDDPMIGTLKGPNLTTGTGSKTVGYSVADWDRAVRHGVRSDGKVSYMPSEDFAHMADRELSDVIAFVRSHPPVDAAIPERSLGPLGKVLVATGQITAFATRSDIDHHAPHEVEPPATALTVEFGRHLAAICTGCHNPAFTGGPIVGGDPSWAPAANITPHADGLGGWTYEQFEAVMRTGIRPSGEAVQPPMDLMPKYAGRMTDTELGALWMYLQSVEARPDPG